MFEKIYRYVETFIAANFDLESKKDAAWERGIRNCAKFFPSLSRVNKILQNRAVVFFNAQNICAFYGPVRSTSRALVRGISRDT